MKRFIILAISVMAALIFCANTASAQYIGADKSLKGHNFSFDKNDPPLDINGDEIWAIYGKQLDDDELKVLFDKEWNHYLANRSAWRVADVIEKASLVSMLVGGACAIYVCVAAMITNRPVSWDNWPEKVAAFAFCGGAATTFVVVMPIKQITQASMTGVVKRHNRTVKVTRIDLASTQNGLGLTMSF